MLATAKYLRKTDQYAIFNDLTLYFSTTFIGLYTPMIFIKQLFLCM